MQNSSNLNKQLRADVDGRGDRISPKRQAKKLFKKVYGCTSGRQYRIMRKKLQRGELDK